MVVLKAIAKATPNQFTKTTDIKVFEAIVLI